MKICWNTLEKVILAKNGDFRCGCTYLVYRNTCAGCGEPYLDHKKRSSIFCSQSCYHNNRSYKHKEKISQANKLKDISGEKNPMYGKRFYGKDNPNYRGGYHSRKLPSYDSYYYKLSPIEKTRRSPKDKGLLEVKCTYCNRWFTPPLTSVVDRIKYINGKISDERRFYCSDNCRNACPIYNTILWPRGFKEATSREVQPELRQMVLKRDNWACQRCGKTIENEILHCHHIDSVSHNPIESADLDNCITFCAKCHIEIHRLSGCNYYELRCNS